MFPSDPEEGLPLEGLLLFLREGAASVSSAAASTASTAGRTAAGLPPRFLFPPFPLVSTTACSSSSGTVGSGCCCCRVAAAAAPLLERPGFGAEVGPPLPGSDADDAAAAAAAESGVRSSLLRVEGPGASEGGEAWWSSAGGASAGEGSSASFFRDDALALFLLDPCAVKGRRRTVGQGQEVRGKQHSAISHPPMSPFLLLSTLRLHPPARLSLSPLPYLAGAGPRWRRCLGGSGRDGSLVRHICNICGRMPCYICVCRCGSRRRPGAAGFPLPCTGAWPCRLSHFGCHRRGGCRGRQHKKRLEMKWEMHGKVTLQAIGGK